MDYFLVLAVLQIIWIDVLLSGDNAVVIALACRELTNKQRKIGISLGVIVAIIARLSMAAVISYILDVPFLKIIGAIFLFWIAVKVIKGENSQEENGQKAQSLFHTIAVIAIADISMSLDNVVAIAAASQGNGLVFTLGLLVSMPLMIIGASIISNIISKFPILVWFGGGLLGWIAGGMIASDPFVANLIHQDMINYGIGATGVLIVFGLATWLIQKSHIKEKERMWI